MKRKVEKYLYEKNIGGIHRIKDEDNKYLIGDDIAGCLSAVRARSRNKKTQNPKKKAVADCHPADTPNALTTSLRGLTISLPFTANQVTPEQSTTLTCESPRDYDINTAVSASIVRPSNKQILGLDIALQRSSITITKIATNSLFAKTPLEVGMMLVSINGTKYTSYEQGKFLLLNIIGRITIVAVRPPDGTDNLSAKTSRPVVKEAERNKDESYTPINLKSEEMKTLSCTLEEEEMRVKAKKMDAVKKVEKKSAVSTIGRMSNDDDTVGGGEQTIPMLDKEEKKELSASVMMNLHQPPSNASDLVISATANQQRRNDEKVCSRSTVGEVSLSMSINKNKQQLQAWSQNSAKAEQNDNDEISALVGELSPQRLLDCNPAETPNAPKRSLPSTTNQEQSTLTCESPRNYDINTAVTASIVRPSNKQMLGLDIALQRSSITITKIAPNSLFAKTPLEVGMMLVSINGTKYTSYEQGKFLLLNIIGRITIVAVRPPDGTGTLSEDREEWEELLLMYAPDDIAPTTIELVDDESDASRIKLSSSNLPQWLSQQKEQWRLNRNYTTPKDTSELTGVYRLDSFYVSIIFHESWLYYLGKYVYPADAALAFDKAALLIGPSYELNFSSWKEYIATRGTGRDLTSSLEEISSRAHRATESVCILRGYGCNEDSDWVSLLIITHSSTYITNSPLPLVNIQSRFMGSMVNYEDRVRAYKVSVPSSRLSSSLKEVSISINGSTPTLASGEWTADEHRLFLEGLRQYGNKWMKFTSLIKSRTTQQVRVHSNHFLRKLVKTNQNDHVVNVQDSPVFEFDDLKLSLDTEAWSPIEKTQFEEGVIIHGLNNWVDVARHVLSKSTKQVYRFACSLMFDFHYQTVERLKSEHERYYAPSNKVEDTLDTKEKEKKSKREINHVLLGNQDEEHE